MNEITGQLIGGPDDGNLVSATVPEIPVRDKTTLWLDGIEEKPTIVETVGTYIWNDERGCFLWKPSYSNVLITE